LFLDFRLPWLFRDTTSKNLESSTVFNQRCNAATHLPSILLPSFVTAVASQSSSSINAACCMLLPSVSHQPITDRIMLLPT